jgi:tetratricopeptide (TPR) repeat protein
MKTEKRHQLQTNELALRLAKYLESLRGKGNLIVGIAIVALIAIGLISYLSNKKDRDRSFAWSEYYTALQSGNRDSLLSVSEAFPDSIAGQWALNGEGLMHLNEGTRLAFSDKARSRERFEKALAAFQTLADQTDDPMLKPRALFGAAQAKEALGRIDEAIADYRQISKAYADNVVGKSAADQAERLSRPAVRDWFTWFAKHEPQTSPLSAPGILDDLGNLPQDADVALPAPGELFKNNEPESGVVIPEAGTPSPTDSDSQVQLPDLPSELELPADVPPATGESSGPEEDAAPQPSATDSAPGDSQSGSDGDTSGPSESSGENDSIERPE